MPTLELLNAPAGPAVGLEEIEASGATGPGVALAVPGDASVDAVHAAARTGVSRIVVRFPVFRDGRGFTLAVRLRERGYAGRLEAEGDLLPDQARHLARCGFDAVVLKPGASADDWRRELDAFSAVYQPAADGAVPVWSLRAARARQASAAQPRSVEDRARALNARFAGVDPQTCLRALIPEFFGRVAMLSSFGAEAAVPLHLLSTVDPSTPVLFLDTGRHFAQTAGYRDGLAARLGLTDVRVIAPSGETVTQADPNGDLWAHDPDRCCAVRKVAPLSTILPQFDLLITGRKRHHGDARKRLALVEVLNGQLRLNLLADWDTARISAYLAEHDLPRHPLVENGFSSIGCWPCTHPPTDNDNTRSGRWPGSVKTECGIHLPAASALPRPTRAASTRLI